MATTLLQTAEERERLLTHAADMPTNAAEASLNVVLLAGSFGTPLVGDIRAKVANDTLQKDSTITMLRRTPSGTQHVPRGLCAVGEASHALAFMINHIYSAHQCNPATHSVYMVTNGLNKDEYGGEAGFFDDVGRFPRNWQEERVLCNDCCEPSHWQGDVSDLKIALAKIQAANNLPTLVIDADTLFWPDFNFQKLVSNLCIRDQPAIAVQCLTQTDVNLYGTNLPKVTFDASGQVPRLNSVTASANVSIGDHVARSVCYLPSQCIDQVLRSDATSVVDLFVELQQSGTTVFGALMPPGYYNLSRLLAQRYGHAFMLYQLRIMKRIGDAEDAPAHATDTVMKSMSELDDVGLGKSLLLNESEMAAFLKKLLKDEIADFDRYFFAFETTRFKGYQLPAYKLPSSFYMTTYRAQVSESSI